MSINTVTLTMILGIIATIVCTVLVCKFIAPEKRREKLNPLGKFLNDLFNFKFLIIEKVLKFFYIFGTVSCVCIGFFMLFSVVHTSYSGLYSSSYSYTYWYGPYGLLLMVLGPIAMRLIYEFSMLGIILVKNVMEINKKLKSDVNEDEYAMPKFKEIINKENFAFMKKKKAEAPVAEEVVEEAAETVVEEETK